ncbi:MAG TPA: SRPBCC family protein [Bacteroidales bacterium]|nr:SRPBCC family protein [Bacteroidales bacterium]
MTKFTSVSEPIDAKQVEVFDFLSDFRNMETLMPEQIINWQASESECSFTVKGMADLAMRTASKSAPSSISIESYGKNPIDYTLDFHIFPEKDNQCKVEINFHAELNPFLSMVASRPLQHLVDVMALKLKEHFE